LGCHAWRAESRLLLVQYAVGRKPSRGSGGRVRVGSPV
jgi:hypothetical protein